ncbi:aminopeptidase [Microbulbifer guangxiensis]|uniref:aminopeptidase n=1 Tax=Microbulbifer guangxiensis TaxID=2904249 RepID=UPI001F248973|nr:aminopeptidase [Microbulbifer guangxiensis]
MDHQLYSSREHNKGICGWRLLAVLLITTALGGCETAGYYAQAATGQMRILAAREPIEKIATAEDTDDKLQQQLALVQAIRAYAAGELKLPVGRAYGAYVKLEDDYPIWNVLAAPEFSLKPRRWCYPIVGCASYRGYFRKDWARNKAQELAADGFDVYLGPVPAYSTLGWFDDPVMSSFVHWPPERLAGLLFHELAHRRVYISGDTQFNESFATAVAQLALPDWRRRQGIDGPAANRIAEAKAVNALMMTTRRQLEAIYDSDLPVGIQRQRKEETLSRLRACYRALSAGWAYPDRYKAYIDKTNNATLALVSEYQTRVPAFQQLYRQSDGWEDFYRATERLGKLDKKERDRRLDALASAYQDSSRNVTGPSFNSETCMSAANMPQATGDS